MSFDIGEGDEIVFFDPEHEARLARAEAQREREQDQPATVKINGKLVSAAAF